MNFKSLILGLAFSTTSLFSVTSMAVMTDAGVEKDFPGTQGAVSTRATDGTPLTTIFASNNAFAGNTFDVQVLGSSALRINGFDVNLDDPGTTNTITLYTRVGSSVGVENDPTEWTLVGSDNAVVSAGTDLPSHVDISGVILEPGVTYGFYIDFESYNGGTAMLYTNGGPNTYADANLQITTNTGQASPAFSGSFFPRQINTTLYYEAAAPVIIPSLSLISLLILASLVLASITFMVNRNKKKA